MTQVAGPRGYHSYRGRESNWKGVLAVVLLLVILAAAGVIGLQRYMVYDETGTPQLRLPEKQEEPPAAQEPEEVKITIQESEEPQKELYAFTVAETPLTQTAWQAAKLSAEASTDPAYNAVAVTVKDSAGKVYFPSVTAVSGAVTTAADTAQTLTELEEWHTIARLSCFHDPKAANADVEGKGLKNTGGYIFYDGNNSQWLDPSKPAARQYLCALAQEAAELGFDEILLTDVSYPTVGKLNKINYGETMKAQNLLTFLEEMRDALAEYDVVLSLELPAAVLTEGSDNTAGLLLTDLAPQVDRVYAVTTADQVETLRQAVTAVSADTEFVPELTGYTGELAGGFLIS